MTLLIMNSLMTQVDLKQEDLASKLVCFGVNGFNTFQGLRWRVTIQIQRQYDPFVVNVHCMAHRTNLVVQTFSNPPLVFHIENMLQCLYGYFNHSPKRHFKFTKLAKIMKTKSNKILKILKQNEFIWFILLSASCLNTTFFSWKWLWMHL